MKVKFVPQNQEFEIRPGQTVLDLAHEKGVPIKSTCNGLPSCAECRVRVVDGEYNVLPPSVKELNLIGSGYFIDQRRLACQLVCFGDVTIDLSEQVEKQKQAPRRLLGNQKIEASNAVSGILIEQDADIKQMLTSPAAVKSRTFETGSAKPQAQAKVKAPSESRRAFRYRPQAKGSNGKGKSGKGNG